MSRRGPDVIHASLVARWLDGADRQGWAGVLIRGGAGSGKSTLALQCMEAGWRLVADDRVVVWRSGASVFGKAPEALKGLIELRGVGVIRRDDALPMAAIALVIDLAPEVERCPEPSVCGLFDRAIPRLDFQIPDAHAPLRLAAALAALRRRL